MAGAFQNNAFQTDAFQTAPVVTTLAISPLSIVVNTGTVTFDITQPIDPVSIDVSMGDVTFSYRATGDVPGGTVLMPVGAFTRKRFRELQERAERERQEIAAKEAAEKKAVREAARQKALAAKAESRAALERQLQAIHEQTRQSLDAGLIGGAQAPGNLHHTLIHTAAMNAMGQAAHEAQQHAMRNRRMKDDEEALALLLGD